MRLAFVLDQQVGLKTQALNLERAVQERPEITPTWVPVRYEADGGLLTRLPGVPGGIKGTLRGVREIRDGLGRERFDAVLWATWAAKSVPDLVGASPALLRMDMTPLQMEAMGEQYGYTGRRARFLGGAKRRATDRLYSLVRRHVPWSTFVADSLVRDYNVPADKVTVISPGVDIDLYHPDTATRPRDGVVRVLFVGGDFGRKGGDLLLRWLSDRKPGEPTAVELHLVTRDETVQNGPGITVYRNLANNSPELVRLYQQCDLFVLPTRADCYSLVALEAMASGLPVVISALGGIPDIVRDGETGFLLTPDDYETLKARLDILVSDANGRTAMGAAGRQRAEAHFDLHNCLGQVLDHMKQAATA